MKNSNVYDVIFYYNEKELLEKRISYLKDVVEKFIIINFGENTDFPDGTIVIEKYKKKFSFFQSDFLNELIKDENLKFIKNFDYLFFSKTKEIPDLEFYKKIKSNQNMDIIFCVHDNLNWSSNLVSPYIYVGTRVINVSTILQKKDLYKQFKISGLYLDIRPRSEKTGWVLNGTQEEKELIDNINFWGPEKLRDLIKEKGIKFFKENLLSLDIPEKITRLIPYKNKVTEFIEYEKILPLREPKDVYLSLDDYEFSIPNKILYGEESYSDFVSSYKKNDVLRILRTQNLFPEDRIHIKEKTELEYSVFTYSQLLEGIPSEMF